MFHKYTHINDSNNNEVIDSLIVVLTTVYAFSRVWSHQEDSLANYLPINNSPYIVLSLLVIFILIRIATNLSIYYALQINHFLLLIMLIIIGVLYYYITGDYSFALGPLVGFTLIKTPPSLIFRTICITCLILMSIQYIGFYTGFFFDINPAQWNRETSSGYISRVAFGFGQPNRVFCYVLPIWLGIHYFNNRKLKLVLFISCLVVTYIDYRFTNTRTMLIVLSSMVLLYPIYNKLSDSPNLYYIIKYLFPLALLVSFIISNRFGNSSNLINSVLSGRPQWWGYYLDSPVSFVGSSNNVSLLFNSELPLDNYFLYILYRGGVLFFIIFTLLYSNFLSICFKEKNNYLIFVAISLFIYGFSEPSIKIVTAPYFSLLFTVLINPSIVKCESC